MGLERHSFHEKRATDRVPVLHRAKGSGPEGQPLTLVIVDLSAGGLMARCDVDLPPDIHIRVTFPAIGVHTVRVCWSLGGRIGCAFSSTLSSDDHMALLASLSHLA